MSGGGWKWREGAGGGHSLETQTYSEASRRIKDDNHSLSEMLSSSLTVFLKKDVYKVLLMLHRVLFKYPVTSGLLFCLQSKMLCMADAARVNQLVSQQDYMCLINWKESIEWTKGS